MEKNSGAKDFALLIGFLYEKETMFIKHSTVFRPSLDKFESTKAFSEGTKSDVEQT